MTLKDEKSSASLRDAFWYQSSSAEKGKGARIVAERCEAVRSFNQFGKWEQVWVGGFDGDNKVCGGTLQTRLEVFRFSLVEVYVKGF